MVYMRRSSLMEKVKKMSETRLEIILKMTTFMRERERDDEC